MSGCIALAYSEISTQLILHVFFENNKYSMLTMLKTDFKNLNVNILFALLCLKLGIQRFIFMFFVRVIKQLLRNVFFERLLFSSRTQQIACLTKEPLVTHATPIQIANTVPLNLFLDNQH